MSEIKKMLRIVSVPYSGTRFAKHMLSPEVQGKDFPYFVTATHCWKEPGMQNLEEWLKEDPAVVVFKRPEEAARSWECRGMPLGELAPTYGNIERLLPFDPVLLPLDSEKKESQLLELSDRLEWDLIFDWEVRVPAQPEGLWPKKDLNEELTQVAVDCYVQAPFLRDWYG
jgi:hypothetical protein